MSKIDPTSPEYQVADEFKPDQEATWPYPAEKDGWVHSHNALRGEMQLMKEALTALQERGEPLVEWQVKALKEAFDSHNVHIHAHHKNEDELFVPVLLKRFKYPEKLTTDHNSLVDKLEANAKLFAALTVGSTVDELLFAWTEYRTQMIPHLQEEEDVGLPLLRAYFSPKDMAPLIQELVKHSPPIEMGSIIHFCGVDRFRNEFMVQEGIPFFVWYIDFQFKFSNFEKVFFRPLEAVKSGEEPKPEESWTKAGEKWMKSVLTKLGLGKE